MALADWKGYLLRAVETDTILDAKFIEESSYKATPNQREEIKAYRDENTRDLTRITAIGKKSKIIFNTRDNLHLKDKIKLQEFFTDAESDHNERKVLLEFWNDEENIYKQGYFYRPDIQFTIKKIEETDIIYSKVEIHLIEY